MSSEIQKGKKVYLQTFGCQMNVLDSELMLGKLHNKGLEETPNAEEADVILYNTCAIREKAEHKVLSLLGDHGRFKKDKPDLQIGADVSGKHRKSKTRLYYVDSVSRTVFSL